MNLFNEDDVQPLVTRPLTKRQILSGVAGVASAAILAACGLGPKQSATAVPTTAGPVATRPLNPASTAAPATSAAMTPTTVRVDPTVRPIHTPVVTPTSRPTPVRPDAGDTNPELIMRQHPKIIDMLPSANGVGGVALHSDGYLSVRGAERDVLFRPGNPLNGVAFYGRNWTAENAVTGSADAKQKFEQLLRTPTAQWFGPWTTDITDSIRKTCADAKALSDFRLDVVPMLVTYNAEARLNQRQYLDWISKVSAGIGESEAVLILEPDFLPQILQLPGAQQAQHLLTMRRTAELLADWNKNLRFYIDAGNHNWIGVDQIAWGLGEAGVEKARGASFNVSNFHPTDKTCAYGDKVFSRLGPINVNLGYVIDTGRNGAPVRAGDDHNAVGSALGVSTCVVSPGAFADGNLWIKPPGESDLAKANGGPDAGQWFESFANGLVDNAKPFKPVSLARASDGGVDVTNASGVVQHYPSGARTLERTVETASTFGGELA